ncbi:type IV pilus biogenesis/stability protein PilW [Paraglaciecola aestuariivivens]
MKLMIKLSCSILVLLLVISGCTSNTNQSIDQLKASKNRVDLGLTYLKNGNFSQAKFNLDKALEFAPRSADANSAMAYYYQTVGELEQAEKAYQYAMDLAPNNAVIANSYGAFLCLNGNYNKAKEYFLKAVNTRSYTNTAETYERLAMCSHSQGLISETEQYLRSAVNHQPGRASSLFLLAEILVESQQYEAAQGILRRYERVAQISPQSLILSIEIAKGLGDNMTAKGYRDMLISVFPNATQTQALLAEEQKVLANIGQTNSAPTKVAKPVIEPISSTQAQTENLDKEIETKSSQSEQTPARFHVVQKGDNLYRISLQYNIKMQRLIEWNALKSASAIYQGMKLSLVPPKAVE